MLSCLYEVLSSLFLHPPSFCSISIGSVQSHHVTGKCWLNYSSSPMQTPSALLSAGFPLSSFELGNAFWFECFCGIYLVWFFFSAIVGHLIYLGTFWSTVLHQFFFYLQLFTFVTEASVKDFFLIRKVGKYSMLQSKQFTIREIF